MFKHQVVSLSLFQRPAYEINFHMPGNNPNLQVIQRPSASGSAAPGHHGNEESDSDGSDEEEYSSSDEEEGEYNTKAAGSLLRHPGT